MDANAECNLAREREATRVSRCLSPSKHGAEAPRSHTSCVLAGTRYRP